MKKTILAIRDYLVIAFALIMPFAIGAQAVTYYVATTGNDNAAGTLAAPWRTAKRAGAGVAVGDTVKFLQGTYTSTMTISKSNTTFTNHSGAYACLSSMLKKHVSVLGNVSGVHISNLSFKANYQTDGGGHHDTFDQQGDQWWGNNDPTHGQNRWHIHNCYFEGGLNLMGSYIVVELCTFNGRGVHPTAIYDSFGSSHHNIYQDNVIYNYTGRGIHSMSYTAYHIALRNHIYGFTGTGLAGIDWDGAGHPVYAHSATFNNVSGTGGRGIENENCLSGCITANNRVSTATYLISFINYTGSDGDFRKYTNNNNAVLRNNLLINAAQVCVRVAAASGVNIYNNTCVGQAGSAYWGGLAIIKVGAWYSQNVVAKNNIFINIEAYPLWVEWTDLNLPGLDLASNLYRKTNGSTTIVNANGIGTYTLAAYAAAAGQEAGSLNGDPALKADFSLPSTSIARNKGVTISGIDTDFTGKRRQYEAAPDIGAIEFKPLGGKNKGFTFGFW